MSPTQRSLRKLRDLGYTCAVVANWNSHAHIRQDLFGCIDILAVRPGEILGVQATTAPNAAAHVTKAKAEPRLWLWLEARCLFEVWAWRKGKRGDGALRRIPITGEDKP